MMGSERSQFNPKPKGTFAKTIGASASVVKTVSGLYHRLAPRAYSVIVFGALVCTLAVKFFHSARHNCVNEYFSWILADVAVLLGIEVVLAIVCFRFPLKLVIRTACVFAALICTWSVMNAGWLIRTGTQILPAVLLPLIRDPINALIIISVNLTKMPTAAVILLAPSAVALVFFFSVLTKPMQPDYNLRRFKAKIILSAAIITLVGLSYAAVAWRGTLPVTSVGMRYNCHLKALAPLLSPAEAKSAKNAVALAKRKIPAFDQLQIQPPPKQKRLNYNIIIVVLEGIQYRHTSTAEAAHNIGGILTPYLASIADAGAECVNARATLTHTTKALFSLLTGRYPSVTQDLAETVPVKKPYASLATILEQELNFRTAFFQSAKGNFEARPSLVHNLGFDKFWARENLNDPNAHLGYLATDEFAMLPSIIEWIEQKEQPFLLTVLCSVTHDPYVVPDWFDAPSKDQFERYKQSIFYTDKFIAALDTSLTKLALRDKTIFCVVGDHGEAFGEHGLLGHERIAFEETLRVPFCIRAPGSITPGNKINKPVSSIDLAPTILALLGFGTEKTGFDGLNVLGTVPPDRSVFFSGWLRQSPCGFIRKSQKYIIDPAGKTVSLYDLSKDPMELSPVQLFQQEAKKITKKVVNWRNSTIFSINQQKTGRTTLYSIWKCSWTGRVCSARYVLQPKQ